MQITASLIPALVLLYLLLLIKVQPGPVPEQRLPPDYCVRWLPTKRPFGFTLRGLLCRPCYNTRKVLFRAPFPFCQYLRSDCSMCTSPDQCATKKCWNGKCVHDSKASMDKCFKPECSPCSSALECETSKCWGKKCVFNTESSKEKCFIAECAICRSNEDCITQYCHHGTCLRRGSISCNLKPECMSCSAASECQTQKCWGSKCVYNTQTSTAKCFRSECASCRSNEECITQHCKLGKCVKEGSSSQSCLKPKPNCLPCQSGKECRSNMCHRGICKELYVPFEQRARIECLFKVPPRNPVP